MRFTQLTNTPRDYAWGPVGGVSEVLGWPPGDDHEAELWLGAHPLSPSRSVGDAQWADLSDWEARTGQRLAFLCKLLVAARPLSLQAHPTAAQARAGFRREEAAGIPMTARERNYRDPNAKPEVLIAVQDGFEALCGFRPVADVVADLDELVGPDERATAPWRRRLAGPDGIRSGFGWLVSGEAGVAAVVAALGEAARTSARFGYLARLAAEYPGDPGVAAALMLNHVTLATSEALWLPGGTIHAYLVGVGIEVMGPSDNVLRGGLTAKHVDPGELQAVLDFTPRPVPRLDPVRLGAHAVAHRPSTRDSGRGVPFELVTVTGDATIDAGSPAILLALDGAFEVSAGRASTTIERGQAWFLDEAASIAARGTGRLHVATAVAA